MCLCRESNDIIANKIYLQGLKLDRQWDQQFRMSEAALEWAAL